MHRTLAVFFADAVSLEHVHNLGTQRSHTGTATDPNHFTTGAVLGTELSVRTAHDDLVAGLQREDVRRSDTGVHIHEAGPLILRLEGRRGNTHVQRDDVALIGIVGHGVSTDGGIGVLTFEREQTELLPCGQVGVTNQALVKILVVVDAVECRNLDLCIRTGLEVHVFAGRQSHLVLFNERSHVLVADNGALPFLDTHYGVVHGNLQIAFHLALTTQAPVLLLLLAREVTLLRVENFTAAVSYLQLALSAAALTATGRRQEDSLLRKCRKQRSALRHGNGVFAVNGDVHIATG